LIALAAGLLLQLFMVFTGNGRLSKILSNLVGGFIAAIVCALFHHFGVGDSLYCMLVGAVISLVPGIAFTNGIRDMVEGDYLAGTIRLLDALVVFASVAVGMAVALTIFSMAGGVIL
ncbi:MAG: threonine/serine exporter family protein, partial [Parasporobacterium sp.]|nr:threonine/serine exporter family protein [Parasporobacterium sp.]